MLSDMTVRNAKGGPKPYKLADGGGMYLLVRPDSARYWRMDYAFEGKRKTLSLGVYPAVKTAAARKAREAAKELLKNGIDPMVERREAVTQAETAAKSTFRALAAEWHKEKVQGEVTAKTQTKLAWMTRVACDEFGDRPIADIKPSEILTMLRKVEARGHLDAATEIRSTVSRVFRYAIVTDRAERGPAADLKGALKTAKVRHMPAILEAEPFGKLVCAIAGYSGGAITRQALRLAPIVFVRPGELRQAEWAEIDWQAREWRIPAEKMKMRRMHIVPLARQAITILEELRPMTGDGRLLFPSPRTDTAPLSDGTLNAALRRLGYSGDEVVAHGFRRTASTMLNEHGWNYDWIERQLAHVEENKVRGAYNAAEHLEGRRTMMQWWADKIDTMAGVEEDLIG